MKHVFKKKELEEISKRVLSEVLKKKNKSGASILALSGQLGAGKTTITQAISKLLGIKEKIVSPTFVIMKIYEINKKSVHYRSFKKLIHIDAYRLENEDDLKKIGWEDISRDKENLIIIEWPERVKGLLNRKSFWVELGHVDDETRSLEF